MRTTAEFKMSNNMKVFLITIFIALVSFISGYASSMLFFANAYAKTPQTRTMYGTYYDYLVVVTDDNHEWSLSKESENPIPFKDGEKVVCTFNTMGTNKVWDDQLDVIVSAN